MKKKYLFLLIISSFFACKNSTSSSEDLESLAVDAYIYGFPMVASYSNMYKLSLDTQNPNIISKVNSFKSDVRLITPSDTTVVTPNTDTPYGFLCLDLSKGPQVLTLPKIDNGRYFSVQFVDMYTFNFEFLGKRTSDDQGGNYLISSLSTTPKDEDIIKKNADKFNKTILSETPLALAFIRIQLYDDNDLANVRDIFDKIKIQSLETFIDPSVKPIPSDIKFPVPPTSIEETFGSLKFYSILDFILSICPPHQSEKELREKFKSLGLNGSFNENTLTSSQKQALEKALKIGYEKIKETEKTKINTFSLFNSREKMREANGDSIYLYRAMGADLGIYGLSADEAIYTKYDLDADGDTLNASTNKYVLHLDEKNLPPVDGFWSFTLYGDDKFLYENEIKRYLINSRMYDNNILHKDPNGRITIYIQKDSPKDSIHKKNWLPAPDGKFNIILRTYLPQEQLILNTWKKPELEKTK